MTGGTNGGAGGLNLRVIGSNTQPTHPVENMIWLNTDKAIPHWYFQNEAPTDDPKVGDVYITITTTATHVLQVLRNNGLKLFFGTARQYDGTKWDLVGGKIYYSGEWHNLQTFVYDGSIGNAENNFNHNVGGYPWARSGLASIGTSTDYFSCNFSGGTGGDGLCRTNKMIDLTSVSKIKITYATTSEGRSVTHQARVFSQAGGGGVVASVDAGGSGSKKTVEINTSSLTGSYYLGFYVYSDVSGHNWSFNYKIYTIELVS